MKVFFQLCLYGNHKEAAEMFASFVTTDFSGMDVMFMIEDSTTPDKLEAGAVRGEFQGMWPFSRTTNASRFLIDVNLWPQRTSIGAKYNHASIVAVKTEQDFVVTLHPDMRFPDPAWLKKCIEWLQISPGCGWVSPQYYVTQEEFDAEFRPEPGFEVRLGAPNVLRGPDLDCLFEATDEIYDPHYLYATHEDWDLLKRLQTELGLAPHMIHTTAVVHRWMGTRGQYMDLDRPEAIAAAARFEAKWGAGAGDLGFPSKTPVAEVLALGERALGERALGERALGERALGERGIVSGS